MRNIYTATLVVLLSISSSVTFGQPAQGLSIVNYLIVSQQPVSTTQLSMTLQADLVNPGTSLPAVTATVTSQSPNVQVVAGQNMLHFAPVPAHTQVSSNDTFTILVDRTVPFDLSGLTWTFQLSTQPPVANAGPDQSARVGQTVTLNGSGSTNPSNVGTLTYSWAFTSVPAGSTATLMNPTSVMPTFVPDVAGDYLIKLTVSNGVASSSATTKVSTTSIPPVANAGPAQTVAVGATVVLNGSASTSGSGNPLTYSWTLLSVPTGSAAVLTGAHTVSPTFVADKAGNYVAQLIVNDGIANSLPSTVTISTQPVKPVANAGPDQVVNVNSTVQLNGSGSTDANGLPLTYQWSLISVPNGSAAVLSNPSAVNPTFIADRPGTYVAQLIVNNGSFASDPDTALITTNPILAPTANAGSNKTIQQGSTVQLNGSGTDPQNLPLTFQWTLINKPAGSSATLSSTVIPNPTFVADKSGDYVAQLVVNNGYLSSAPSTVTFSTTCAQATANAGPNQNVTVGATVTLDGSASGDVCHDPLTYSWSLISRPAASSATLSGANTVSPSFVADVVGTYVAQLIVNNGLANSTPATVTITASNASGIIVPATMTVPIGQTVNLPLSLASPAPAGGVFLTLSSSDPSIVTVSAAILIQEGLTSGASPKLNGINFGTATITVSAPGFSPVSTVVKVTSGVLTFIPPSLTINGAVTQNFTLALTPPSPTSVTINLSSSDPTVATVPSTVTIPANASSVSVPVTAVGNGSTIIHASSATLADTTAKVDAIVSKQIILQAGIKVGINQSVDFPITLSAAPATDLTVTLTSSDPSTATVTASVVIPKGQTSPAIQPKVSGVNPGTANITVSAPSYTSATQSVQVTGSLTLTGPLSITIGTSGNLTLNLAGGQAPPNGLVVTLASSNPSVASVPATVTIPGGQTSVTIPVTALTLGSTSITATAGALSATAGITVVPACSTCLIVSSASVGKNLQTLVSISLPNGSAPAGGITVTVASSDPSKVLLGSTGQMQDTVTIAQGNTTGFVLVQGLDTSGTVGLTASAPGYGSGGGFVTLTPSAFVLSGPNGIGQPFSLGIGGQATLTVTAERLDSTLKVAETQPVRNGSSVTVNLSSSNPSVGTTSPASVTFTGGDTSATVQFTSLSLGSTTISASVPAGFSTPANGLNSVTVTGNTQSLTPSSMTVGQGLEATANVLFTGQTTAQTDITLTSHDPTKLLLSVTPNGAGSASITLSVPPGHINSQDFYLYGLAKSGTVDYSAAANGFNGGIGTVTLAPSGFVISGPGGIGATDFFTTPQAGDTQITISPAILNQANGFVAKQALAGSGSVDVVVTSSNQSVGTITSPVTVSGGSSGATTFFHPLTTGATTLAVSTPAGFTTPTNDTSITAQVFAQSIFITDGVTVGQNLETSGFVTLPAPTPSDLALTLTSNNPSLLKLSTTATNAGSTSIVITIPAGSSTGQYWLQGFGSSGVATYTGSAAGYVSRTGTIRFAPSGVVISGPLGFSVLTGQPYPATISLAGGPSPLSLSVGVLDSGGNFLSSQPLAGGFGPLAISLNNTDSSVGTVPAQGIIPPGNDSGAVLVTPVKQGTTNVSVVTPTGFGTSNQYTSILVIVGP